MPAFASQINGDEAHIHVSIDATAHVFAPRNGMELMGTVSKVAATHLSILAYGVFNATVTREGIDKCFAFDDASEEWQQPNGEFISVGKLVTFRVMKIQHAEVASSAEDGLREMLVFSCCLPQFARASCRWRHRFCELTVRRKGKVRSLPKIHRPQALGLMPR